MDSKEILETFGISKNFAIILFIQSIIVIIGCFLAFQDIYFNIAAGNFYVVSDIISLVFFIILLYYSFIGFRKREKYFKIATYCFIIYEIISLLNAIGATINFNTTYFLVIIAIIIKLILLCYFVYNLNNYDKAKIAILLVILVELILWIIMNITLGRSIGIAIPKLIFLIPCVSIALTYIARYNKDGFKQINK